MNGEAVTLYGCPLSDVKGRVLWAPGGGEEWWWFLLECSLAESVSRSDVLTSLQSRGFLCPHVITPNAHKKNLLPICIASTVTPVS